MNWTRVEGAVLEHLLVCPADLSRIAKKKAWSQATDEARARWGYTPSDIAAYYDWFRHFEGAATYWHTEHPLWMHLRVASSRLIFFSGRECRLRDDLQQPGLERLVWRWLSLAVPPLTLCAANSSAVPSGDATAQVLAPMMAPAGPAAVLHVHYGQLLDFEQIWFGLCQTFRRTGTLSHTTPEGNRTLPVRYARPPQGFEVVGRRTPRGLLWEAALTGALAVRTALELLAEGGALPSALQTALHSFGLGDALRLSAFDWGTLRGAGRARRRNSEEHIETLSEFRLQNALFRQLARTPQSSWRSAFENYLRVRAILYAHVVHRSSETGLAAFVAKAEHTDPYEAVAGVIRQTGLEANSRYLRVGAIEARCTPSTWIKEEPNRYFPAKPRQSPSLHRIGDSRLCESAWIVAFDRAPARASDKRLLPGHYHAWRGALDGAARVERVIRAYPLTLRSTRGLDVMGLEKEGPLWVILPAVMRLRRYARQVAACDRRRGVVPLRLTIHAGEDFDHQLTGLRHISEPLLWGAFERGDRLGHATPLGLDSSKWAEKHPLIMTTWWDRLIDIGWAVDSMHRFRLQCADSLWWMAEDARGCIHQIWPKAAAAYQMDPLIIARSLWIWCGDAQTLGRLNYPWGGSNPQQPALQLLEAYLFSRAAWDRARCRTCVVNTGRDLPLTLQLQNVLRKLIARLQIAVEIQPSSNLFVGGVDDLLDQPFYHLRTPTDTKGEDALALAISSDDPLSFATTTEDEYGYAWAGMVAGGRQPSLATRWLDDVAESSMRARFTDFRSREWALDAWRT